MTPTSDPSPPDDSIEALVKDCVEKISGNDVALARQITPAIRVAIAASYSAGVAAEQARYCITAATLQKKYQEELREAIRHGPGSSSVADVASRVSNQLENS
jgi:hypothetical protein